MKKPDDRVLLLDNEHKDYLFRKEACYNRDGGVTLMAGQKASLFPDDDKKIILSQEEMAKLYVWYTEWLRYRRDRVEEAKL